MSALNAPRTWMVVLTLATTAALPGGPVPRAREVPVAGSRDGGPGMLVFAVDGGTCSSDFQQFDEGCRVGPECETVFTAKGMESWDTRPPGQRAPLRKCPLTRA